MLERGSFSDELVLDRMESFHAVVIDRDVTPEIARRFNVSGYPAMLILNADEQKIHRWSGYSTTDYFLSQVDEALGKFARFRAGKEWDIVESRTEGIVDGGAMREFPAPESSNAIRGLVHAGGRLWCLQLDRQNETLYELDPASGEKIAEYPVPPRPDGRVRLIVDLAADEESLYLPPYGWSKGDGILRFDLENRRYEEEEIVTAANLGQRASSTKGIASLPEGLLIRDSRHGGLVVIDRESGKVLRRIRVSFPGKLEFSTIEYVDGTIWAPGRYKVLERDQTGVAIPDSLRREAPWRHAIFRIDPDDGSIVDRIELAWNAQSIAVHEGSIYLSDRTVWGYDVDNQKVRLFPVSFEIRVLRGGSAR